MRKHVQILLVLLMYIFACQVSLGQLIITELMPRNVSYRMNDRYDFAGWTEIHNVSDDSVNVLGMIISNGSKSWQCELDSLIRPNDYFVFYFDELGEANHVDFKLDAEGGEIYLYDGETGSLIDVVTYPKTYRNASYGRGGGKDGTWGHLKSPSCGFSNETIEIFDRQSEIPYFSLVPGFYDSVQSVEIKSNAPSAKIYYTTDGTEPFESDSLLYETPILVDKNTPIRAISVENNALPSIPLSGSFFIGERNIKLPVVSLVVDPKYFFDNEIGIYVEGNGRYKNVSTTCGGNANYWGDESRPCNFELFKNGEQVFSQEVKTKNSGACSRRFIKKSMKINASGVVGESRLDHDFFQEKSNRKWKSIVLRNDGNDLTFNNSILIRDGFIQSLLPNTMNIDHLAFQPSVVFINGSYYGVLNIRERSDENFVYSNYGLVEESIDFDENIKKPTNEEYIVLRNTMDSIFSEDKMDEFDRYELVDSLIDIDEWLNYFMIEVYVGNTDWPLNNSKVWKRKIDGKWRYILFDLDFGFWGSGTCEASMNTVPYAEKNKEFSVLIKDEKILSQYINKFIVNIGTTFQIEHVANVFDSIMSICEPELLYYWENELNRKLKKWETNKEKILQFAQDRPFYILQYLRDYYSLGDTASLRIFTEEQNAEFFLSGERINVSDFHSYCFDSFPLLLTCCPPDGFRFDHWVVTTADSSYMSNEEELQTIFHGATSFHAVLRKDDSYDEMPKVFLNEICSTNKMYVDEYRESDDWIEIYNAGSSPVDLGGMYLSDGKNNLQKFRIPDDNPAQTTVMGKSYIVFWADEQTEQGPLHTNFSLSASKQEKVSLSMRKDDEDFVILDSVTYELHEKGETFARFSYDDFGSWTKTKWPTFSADNRLLGYERTTEENKAEETTSLEISSFSVNVSVCPNPVIDMTWISIPWKSATYSLYSNGVLCMMGALKNNQPLNMYSLPSGFYLLSIEDDKSHTKEYVKIIKR